MNQSTKRPRLTFENEPGEERDTAGRGAALRDAHGDNPFLVSTPAPTTRTASTALAAVDVEADQVPPIMASGARPAHYPPGTAGAATVQRRRPLGTILHTGGLRTAAAPPSAISSTLAGYPTTQRRTIAGAQRAIPDPTPSRTARKAIDSSLLDSGRISYFMGGLNLPTPGRAAKRAATAAAAAASPSSASLLADQSVDAIEAKFKVNELSFQLDSQRSETERKLLEAANFAHRLQQQLKERIQRVEKLELDRKLLYDRDCATQARVKKLEDELEQAQEEKSTAIAELQREKLQFSQRLAEKEMAQQANERESHISMHSQQTNQQDLEHRLRVLQTQLEQQTQLAQDRQQKLADTQDALSSAEHTIQRLRCQGEDSPNAAMNATRLRNQSMRLRELEKSTTTQSKELDYLRSTQRSATLLEQENQRLAERAEQLDMLRLRCVDLEEECAKLRKERDNVLSFLGEEARTINLDTPNDMSAVLSGQRMDLLTLTERHGALQAELMRHQDSLLSANTQIKELKTQLDQLERKQKSDQLELNRHQRMKVLAQKEVDFLREQLKSYDIEGTMNTPSKHTEALQARVDEMSSMIDSYKQQLDQGPSLDVTCEALQQENSDLKKELAQLDTELGRVERTIGRGDYDRRTTRVLQLTNNIAAQDFCARNEMLDALRNENHQLLQQLHDPSTGSGSSTATSFYNDENVGYASERPRQLIEDAAKVPRQSLLNVQAEVRRLEDILDVKEKRSLRLRETFTSKGREFRDTVYRLLGYRLSILSEGRVRLVSAFSRNGDQSFTVRSDPATGMLSLTTHDCSDAMEQTILPLKQKWLAEKQSIPAFLSACTLVLFERAELAGDTEVHALDAELDDIDLDFIH